MFVEEHACSQVAKLYKVDEAHNVLSSHSHHGNETTLEI
ncbi:Protein CBG25882 [Caenorhabditis briggsae]|uniref:Protein CBG25882 n=1 Tax=Caenorhabditis briggsae TaxID=6238 RepID=B6IHN7_CAEBR|nr:Protein CBG25882 [Caenorhabditis briggsae]CAR99393.1 Protein CBG25882 [Caenorhabditis briggsae]